jgi:hypothetical protein
LSLKYHTNLPPTSEKCKLNLTTKLSTAKVKMGETVRLTTQLTNKTNDGLPMTMAVVGIPAGLSVQGWQLKELQTQGVFDFFETTDQAVIFYYRQMKPSQIKNIILDLKTEFAGKYQAQASSAYLYYTAENKLWVQGNAIEITE